MNFYRRLYFIPCLSILSFILFIAIFSGMSQAAVITVDETPNGGNGCKLVDAINAANTNLDSGGCKTGSTVIDAYGTGTTADTINLLSDVILTGEYPFLSDTFNGLIVDSKIILNGMNHTIKRDTTKPDFGIFRVGWSQKGDLSLNNITIMNAAFPWNGVELGFSNTIENKLKMSNCTMKFNSTGLLVNGHAIAVINNSTFSNNGQAIENDGNVITITKSTIISNNHGLQTSGPAKIDNSTFSNNSVALYTFGDTTITNSTFNNNECTDSTQNIISSFSNLTLENVTISQNNVTSILEKPAIIYNQGYLLLKNSIITNNNNGTQGSGSIINTITNGSPITEIDHTIIAKNSGLYCIYPGLITSKGYNISDGISCDFANTGDQQGVDPNSIKLGTLRDNGGFTKTIALLPGSIAINKGNVNTCNVSTDQRGQKRPSLGSNRCDIGAYETQPNAYLVYLASTSVENRKTINLADEFRPTGVSYVVNIDVKDLLNPVVINNVRTDINIRLTSYPIISSPCPTNCAPLPKVKITNQFGTLNLNVLDPAKSVLINSNLRLASSPSNVIDPTVIESNYLCYSVTLDTGSTFVPKTITVKEVDSPLLFAGSVDLNVNKPVQLCNRNTTTPRSFDNHLVCYSVTPPANLTLLASTLFTNNKYGPDQFKVTKLYRVCVPSQMTKI